MIQGIPMCLMSFPALHLSRFYNPRTIERGEYVMSRKGRTTRYNHHASCGSAYPRCNHTADSFLGRYARTPFL